MSDKKDDIDKDSQDEANSVFFDGDCPMCRNFVARTDGLDVLAKDLRTQTLPTGVSLEQASASLHYLDENSKIYRGAPAVLRILSKKGGISGLIASLMLLPPFIYFAHLVYMIVAKNRFVLFGEVSRLTYVKITATFACIFPMLISHRLWLGNWQRAIPRAPLVDLPISVNNLVEFPFDVIILSTLISCLLVSAILPQPKKTLLFFLCLAIPYSLFDLNRLMPYYMEFYWMFLLLALYSWPKAQATEAHRASSDKLLAVVALALFGIWFWSGLHKLNITYLMTGYPWLISSLTQYLSPSNAATLNSLAILTPLIESFAALALVFSGTRMIGVIGITLMHLLILVCIGPFGHNYNHSVWSWNIAHIVFCWLVFYRCRFSFLEIFKPKGVLHWMVLLWFIICPALSYLHLWPRTLSYSLYTWAGAEAEIQGDNPQALSTLAGNRYRLENQEVLLESLDFKSWYYAELNSPPFDLVQAYKDTFAQLCIRDANQSKLKLYIHSRPDYLSGKRETTEHSCPN